MQSTNDALELVLVAALSKVCVKGNVMPPQGVFTVMMEAMLVSVQLAVMRIW